MNEMFWFRGFERLLAVVIGGVSVWLGYQLFLHLPDRVDGQGKLILPGGVSVLLSRVGPGVFFGLFGAAVVVFSLSKPVSLGVKSPNVDVDAVMATDTAAESTVTAPERALALNTLDTLRRLELALEEPNGAARLGQEDVDLVLTAIPRVKLLVLSQVWDPQWGSWADFEQWARRGDPASRSPSPDVAARYFSSPGGGD